MSRPPRSIHPLFRSLVPLLAVIWCVLLSPSVSQWGLCNESPDETEETFEEIEPYLLRTPTNDPVDEPFGIDFTTEESWPFQRFPPLATAGYAGPSGIAPSELQQSNHFVPVEDRWRIGFPNWDRHKADHKPGHDYPYQPGHWWDPYNQNLLKGDYPLIGQHMFVSFTGSVQSIVESRRLPNVVTSTSIPPTTRSGDPDQIFSTHFFRLQMNLTHGTGAFKPVDWQIRVTPVFNLNTLWAGEPTVLNPKGSQGLGRARSD
ncbi:MAG: hypothetical protein FJ267_08200, partial [Planctomycetes bacterium]|nr:hypothetical protein [Planctomycetota bacterium]